MAVIRESLINCAKHAHATEATIRVAVDLPELVCEVSDNGNGYTSGTRVSGVANMQSRATELGGEFTIGTRPDALSGTYVRWSVPLV